MQDHSPPATVQNNNSVVTFETPFDGDAANFNSVLVAESIKVNRKPGFDFRWSGDDQTLPDDLTAHLAEPIGGAALSASTPQTFHRRGRKLIGRHTGTRSRVGEFLLQFGDSLLQRFLFVLFGGGERGVTLAEVGDLRFCGFDQAIDVLDPVIGF